MAFTINYIIYWHNYMSYDMPSLNETDSFLMGSPLPMATILILYIYFCKYAGPKFMKNREPYSLETIMIVYNFIQILANFYICVKGTYLVHEMWIHDGNMLCAAKNTHLDPAVHKYVIQEAQKLSYLFTMLKISDLLDTIFMVLKKNFHQVTFLHLYHHSLMVIVCWIVSKYVPRSYDCFTALINAYVHVMMYTYYLISVYDPSIKNNLSIKKGITITQLIQFVILVFINQFVIMDDCEDSKIIAYINDSQALTMIILFSNFYYNAYILKPKLKKLNENVNNKEKQQ